MLHCPNMFRPLPDIHWYSARIIFTGFLCVLPKIPRVRQFCNYLIVTNLFSAHIIKKPVKNTIPSISYARKLVYTTYLYHSRKEKRDTPWGFYLMLASRRYIDG